MAAVHYCGLLMQLVEGSTVVVGLMVEGSTVALGLPVVIFTNVTFVPILKFVVNSYIYCNHSQK